ncbi:hypothetical protein OSTOST_00313, partial [Ostertagia ostertagi]
MVYDIVGDDPTLAATLIVRRTGIPRTYGSTASTTSNGRIARSAVSVSCRKSTKSSRSTSQRGLMVWTGASWNGKTELLFVEPGLKINADYYIRQLRDDILPSCSSLYRDGRFVLQQDRAPAHAARKTLAFLDSVGVEYLKKTEYPSALPDLNPLDYRVWAELNRTVYEGRE